MSREGPEIERLVHRLAECPQEFLATPRIGKNDGVHVDAVVRDLLVDLGGEARSPLGVAVFHTGQRKLNERALRLVLIACWLLGDPWFSEGGEFAAAAFTWLRDGLKELAKLVAPQLFVTDPDRREELARLCLGALGLRPKGEPAAVAEDRLRTLDSVLRVKLVRETREKQERARQLRREMEQQRAREAAARVSREW
jgi:hypothetical protein